MAQQVAQQQQRRPVDPVQVVEDEQQRRALRRAADQRRDGFEEAIALGLGILRRGSGPGGAGSRGQERLGQDPGELREVAGGDRIVRPGAVAQPVAQRLDERLVGAQRLLLAAPVEDGRAAGVGLGRELRGEPRLADPGLAVEQHEPALAAARLPPGQPQPLQLVRAPDERRGRRRSADHRQGKRTLGVS